MGRLGIQKMKQGEWLETGVLLVRGEELAAWLTLFPDPTRNAVSEAELPVARLRATEVWERTFGSVPDLISIHDRQHRIVLVNQAFARWLGKTPEECIGLRCFACVHAVESPPASCPHALTCQDGQIHTVEVHDNALRGDCQVTTIPLCDQQGVVLGSLHVIRDMAERRRAAQALRQNEADLNRAQAIARVGSWRLDVRQNDLRWSDEVYRIFGIPKSTPLNYESFLTAVHPEDREYVHRKWRAALRGEPYDIEHRVNAGGTVKWVRERVELEFNPEGGLLGGFGTVQDITELKQAEEAVRQSEERRRAEERVRELNEQLNQRVGELAAANAELEAFSYSVSHDLRAPLRQVAGFTKLLQDAAAGKLDPDSAEYFALIQRAVKRMEQLIDALLTFSRMGRTELNRGEVDFLELAGQVWQTLQPALKDRVIDFILRPLPKVTGDVAMLRQVMVNLVDNALKFTRSRPRAEVEIGCTSSLTEHTFFVRDNGVGFEPRYQDRLFGVFQRLHSAAEFEGTGIGLAIVRRIVQRHGGRTWAESIPKQGAAFYFSLPKDL